MPPIPHPGTVDSVCVLRPTFSTTLAGAGSVIAVGNAARRALHVVAPLAALAAGDVYPVLIGFGPLSAPQFVAAISSAQPSIVLRYEDWGVTLLGDIVALDANGGTPAVYATELVEIR